MRISCVGGGPAGLYFAILMKLRDSAHQVTVFERDPAGRTYGWGGTLWADLLRRLHDSDPVSARQVRESSFGWQDQVVDIQGQQTVRLGGPSGFSISRQELLGAFTNRALELGVDVQFEHEINDASQL